MEFVKQLEAHKISCKKCVWQGRLRCFKQVVVNDKVNTRKLRDGDGELIYIRTLSKVFEAQNQII